MYYHKVDVQALLLNIKTEQLASYIGKGKSSTKHYIKH